MPPEQFRAILARHGGLIGHQVVDPEVDVETTNEITGKKTTAKGPNPSPRVRYVTRDGEIVARQHDDGTFDVLEDPKGLVRASLVADAGGDATPAQAETARHNRATEAAAANTAARQGRNDQRQLTVDEMRAANEAKKAELDARVTNREMDAAQAKAEYDRWWDQTIRIPAERHKQEIEDAQRRLDEEKAAFERRKYQQEQVSAREKEQTRQREADRAFAYTAGQDAVANRLKLLPYEVDPSFGPSLAGIYNRIMPGAFQPGAFTTQLPDLDALAQRHIGPLLDLHASPVTGPSAQAAAAQVAQPGQPATDPLANVPITPRPSTPGAATAIQAGGVGGNPTQDEIARRIAAGYGT